MLPYNSSIQNKATGFDYFINSHDQESFLKQIERVGEERSESLFGPQVMTYFYGQKLGGRFPGWVVKYFVRTGTMYSMLYSGFPVARNAISCFGGPSLTQIWGSPPQVTQNGEWFGFKNLFFAHGIHSFCPNSWHIVFLRFCLLKVTQN